jgi:hypothetical protein
MRISLRKDFKVFEFMKFTQTEAAKKISAILTRGGKKCYLSERTINEQLDTLMKLLVNDETELDDFISKVEPMFKTSNGNAQNDQSEFVRLWNEQHPEPKPNPEPDPKGNLTGGKPNETKPEDKTATLMQELLEKINGLEQARNADLLERQISEKRNELRAELKKKGVANDKWIDIATSKLAINADTAVEDEATSLLEQYNLLVTNQSPTPTPGQPNGSGQAQNDSLKLAAQMVKEKRERGEII